MNFVLTFRELVFQKPGLLFYMLQEDRFSDFLLKLQNRTKHIFVGEQMCENSEKNNKFYMSWSFDKFPLFKTKDLVSG